MIEVLDRGPYVHSQVIQMLIRNLISHRQPICAQSTRADATPKKSCVDCVAAYEVPLRGHSFES